MKFRWRRSKSTTEPSAVVKAGGFDGMDFGAAAPAGPFSWVGTLHGVEVRPSSELEDWFKERKWLVGRDYKVWLNHTGGARFDINVSFWNIDNALIFKLVWGGQ